MHLDHVNLPARRADRIGEPRRQRIAHHRRGQNPAWVSLTPDPTRCNNHWTGNTTCSTCTGTIGSRAGIDAAPSITQNGTPRPENTSNITGFQPVRDESTPATLSGHTGPSAHDAAGAGTHPRPIEATCIGLPSNVAPEPIRRAAKRPAKPLTPD